MAQRALGFRRQHQAGRRRQAGQHGAGLGQRVLQAAAGGRERGGDRLALLLGQFAELQQPVDEQPQALVGRQAAGRGVRREQQAGLGQVGHDVADRRRRQAHGQPAGQGAAADRLAGLDVLLDDLAQHRGRAGVEARRQGDARRDNGGVERFVHDQMTGLHSWGLAEAGSTAAVSLISCPGRAARVHFRAELQEFGILPPRHAVGLIEKQLTAQ